MVFKPIYKNPDLNKSTTSVKTVDVDLYTQTFETNSSYINQNTTYKSDKNLTNKFRTKDIRTYL